MMEALGMIALALTVAGATATAVWGVGQISEKLSLLTQEVKTISGKITKMAETQDSHDNRLRDLERKSVAA